MGGFSIVSPSGWRMDIDCGEVRHARSTEVEHFLDMFVGHDIIAEDYSRRQFRGGGPTRMCLPRPIPRELRDAQRRR